MYLIVDGGATKTVAFSFDEKNLKFKKFGIGGSSSIKNLSKEVALKNIKKAVNEAWIDDINIAIFGLTGVGDSRKSTETIENALNEAFPDLKKIVVNDGILSLYTVTMGKPGAVVVAGTGSVGYAYTGKDYLRVGGWGYIAGDQGSAYWIGRRALEYAIKSEDRIVEYTLIKDLITNYKGMELKEYMNKLFYDFKVEEIAGLAKLVDIAYSSGDKIAGMILEEAAEELIALMNVLVNVVGENSRIGFLGGVMNSQAIVEMLKKRFPNALFFKGYENIIGGALYLLSKSRKVDENLRNKIIKSFNEFDLEKYL